MGGFLAAGSELVPGFESALAIDDGFALAEIGRARCLATYGPSGGSQGFRRSGANTRCGHQAVYTPVQSPGGTTALPDCRLSQA